MRLVKFLREAFALSTLYLMNSWPCSGNRPLDKYHWTRKLLYLADMMAVFERYVGLDVLYRVAWSCSTFQDGLCEFSQMKYFLRVEGRKGLAMLAFL